MNWLLARLARLLLGPAVEGITDDMLDGITLAIHEEAERMGLKQPTAFEKAWAIEMEGARFAEDAETARMLKGLYGHGA